MVNIPRYIEDDHYRYKMAILEVRIEGRGNGIKTRLINISDISKSLDRPVTYLIKFFGFELGAQVDVSEMLVNGKHDPEDLSEIMDRFIEKYVLCGECSNPETILTVKKDVPKMKCKACGHTTIGDVSHKIANYISKFPPIDPNAKKEPGTIEELFDYNALPGENGDELENDWAVSTAPEEVAKRQLALCGGSIAWVDDIDPDAEESPESESPSLFGVSPYDMPLPRPSPPAVSETLKKITPTENPLNILAAYWAEGPRGRDVVFNIGNVAKFCRWSEEDTLKNVFASMWMDFKIEGAVVKSYYLSLFVKEDVAKQKLVLRYMEKMAADSKPFALRFPDILVMFWEERVLDTDIIKKWYAHPNSKIPEKLSKFLRDKSEKVMKWLDKPEDDGIPSLGLW